MSCPLDSRANSTGSTRPELLACSQEFGSPSTNGFGHKKVKAKNPETQKLADCVFIPKRHKGEWDAEVCLTSSIRKENVVDTDADALLPQQL